MDTKTVVEKGANRIKTIAVSYIKRYMIIGFVWMLILILGVFSWGSQRPLLGMVIFMGIPISMIFTLGNVKDRLVNGLSLISVYLYLIFALLFGWWNEAAIILMGTPYVSLLIKPKRSLLKYGVTLLSTLLLIYGLVTGESASWAMKWGLIVVIYILFLPPVLLSIFN